GNKIVVRITLVGPSALWLKCRLALAVGFRTGKEATVQHVVDKGILCELLRRFFMKKVVIPSVAGLVLAFTAQAWAGTFTFTTGDPDGLIATASRPASTGKIETETADDFILTQQTMLTGASFTGLLINGAT